MAPMNIAQGWAGQHDTNLWGGSGAGSGLGVGGVTNRVHGGPSTRRIGGQPAPTPMFNFGGGAEPQGQVSPILKALGGASFYSPITQGKVFDQGAEDRQVNQMRATASGQTEGGIRRMNEQMGARGFGSNSPAAMEMAQNQRARNLSNMNQAENNFRFDTAERNAQMVTQREGLRLGQQQSANQDDIARRRMQTVGYGLTPGTYKPRGPQSALSQAMYNQKPQEYQLAQNLGQRIA